MEVRLVFHISKEDVTYNAKMDSADEKVFGIAASATKFKDSIVDIVIAKAGIRYHGQYGSNGIEGIIYQSGQSFPLHLTRNLIAKKSLYRPQEPKEPYPYINEEVCFPATGVK